MLQSVILHNIYNSEYHHINMSGNVIYLHISTVTRTIKRKFCVDAMEAKQTDLSKSMPWYLT